MRQCYVGLQTSEAIVRELEKSKPSPKMEVESSFLLSFPSRSLTATNSNLFHFTCLIMSLISPCLFILFTQSSCCETDSLWLAVSFQGQPVGLRFASSCNVHHDSRGRHCWHSRHTCLILTALMHDGFTKLLIFCVEADNSH